MMRTMFIKFTFSFAIDGSMYYFTVMYERKTRNNIVKLSAKICSSGPLFTYDSVSADFYKEFYTRILKFLKRFEDTEVVQKILDDTRKFINCTMDKITQLEQVQLLYQPLTPLNFKSIEYDLSNKTI